MRTQHAAHRDLGRIKARRRAADRFHRAADRQNALALGLRELKPAQKPCQALVAPPRRHRTLAQIVKRDP